MVTRFFGVIILILCCCLAFLLVGCPKKTVLKEEPSVTAAEQAAAAAAAEREKASRLDAERAAQELKAKEEAARRAEADKGLDKTLVAKKYPGIEGEIKESKLLKDVYFDFDRYDIRPQDVPILKENADVLMKNPGYKVQIEGHCDERGTIEYNLALGERRANSVKNYLMTLGLPKGRISTISYGKERPLDPGHTEEAWAKNRRAHTVILSR